MKNDRNFSRLPERRMQLIHLESFLLLAALLSQLSFVVWMGFGTRSMTAAREFMHEPVLWIFFAANVFCWSLIFIVRFFWQGFDGGSDHDALTGLYDRGYFERILEMEMRRAGRYHDPLAVCILDLDRFAALNQKWGRKKGDETLRKFADLLRSCVRITDLAARFGRDEFAVLLPHTDAAKAEKFISRIVAQMQERLDCGFSAGVTAFHAGDSQAQVVERALLALRQAKHEGTGKVRSILSGQEIQPAPGAQEIRPV